MVLISTENLERMRQQLQRQPTVENTANPENATNDSVRTPGTPLSRLDAEMSRILNSSWPKDEGERWKMYKETLWRYLHLVHKMQGLNQDETRNEGAAENVANNDSPQMDSVYEDAVADDGGDVTMRNLESSSKSIFPSGIAASSTPAHKKYSSLEVMKSVNRIVDSVPKSYRLNARLLMRELLDKAVPSRLSWDEHGVVTINGSVIKDSNIEDLINDAMRERKTVKAVGRVQFARMLFVLKIPTSLVGNKKFLIGDTSNTERIIRSLNSSPDVSLSTPGKKRRKGIISGRKRRRAVEEEASLNSSPNVSLSAPRKKRRRRREIISGRKRRRGVEEEASLNSSQNVSLSAPRKKRRRREIISGGKRKRGEEEEKEEEALRRKEGNCRIFLAPYFRQSESPVTFMKNVASKRKRRLLDWSKLK